MQDMDTLEEKLLLERFGRENHFQVPEGYFDNLTDQIMAKRPKQKVRQHILWRWVSAAMLVGCVAVGGILLYHSSISNNQMTAEQEYMEEELNYSMIDNNEISAFLTEAE